MVRRKFSQFRDGAVWHGSRMDDVMIYEATGSTERSRVGGRGRPYRSDRWITISGVHDGIRYEWTARTFNGAELCGGHAIIMNGIRYESDVDAPIHLQDGAEKCCAALATWLLWCVEVRA
jgi:hypothetical protein